MRFDMMGAYYFGAFLMRPPEKPTRQTPSPDGVQNTGATVTLSGTPRDILCRGGFISYRLDRVTTWNTPSLQTSPGVSVKGNGLASWVSAPIANGVWYWQAIATSFAIGSGPVFPAQTFAAAVLHNFNESYGQLNRALVMIANRGIPAPAPITQRTLMLIENKAVQAIVAGIQRQLFILDNRQVQGVAGLQRALFLLESYTNGAMFPWLFSLQPNQQYRGGQIGLVGDGFGDTAAAWTSSTLLGAIRELMGVVSWSSRSPGLYPCNGGAAWTPAITVTVPMDAVSGLVMVEETTP
jgi:hypothetical protein